MCYLLHINTSELFHNNACQVFYQQNKGKVRELAAKLQKEQPNTYPINVGVQALTELFSRLSKAEVDGLQREQ
jgi:hypothetical protein